MLKVVEMSDEQINNCLVFLNRANLAGSEAEALVLVKQSLKCAVPQSDYLRVQNNSGKGNKEATTNG